MNTQAIALDVSKRASHTPVVVLRQGDRNGTTLEAAITDNGDAMALTGYTVRLCMRLPDNAHYYSVDGTASGNVAAFPIDETYAAAYPGRTDEAYVEVIDGSTVICSTHRFAVEVEPGAREGAEPGEQHLAEIDEVVAEVRALIDEIQEGAVFGVKGNAETDYRTGSVNLTPANIGAAEETHAHAMADVTGLIAALNAKLDSLAVSASQTATGADITVNGSTVSLTNGADGQDGEDGYSPSASVERISTGATITIEDADGVTTATVYDGTNGTNGANGRDGMDGITPEVDVTSITGGHNVAFDYGSGDPRNADFDVMDGSVTGVKGSAEYEYRHGDVSLSSDDIGAIARAGGRANGLSLPICSDKRVLRLYDGATLVYTAYVETDYATATAEPTYDANWNQTGTWSFVFSIWGGSHTDVTFYDLNDDVIATARIDALPIVGTVETTYPLASASYNGSALASPSLRVAGIENAVAMTKDGTVEHFGETAYPTFTRSSWGASSDQSTLPVTPCFVLDTTNGGLYFCDGTDIYRINEGTELDAGSAGYVRSQNGIVFSLSNSTGRATINRSGDYVYILAVDANGNYVGQYRFNMTAWGLACRFYENGAWGSWESHVWNALASRTANTVLAAPNGSAGAATFRALTSDDCPWLDRKIDDQSANVKCPTATWTAIASVTLAAGIWVVCGNLYFASNATGRRYACIHSTTPTTAAQRQRGVNQNATNGAATQLNVAVTINVTSSTTFSVYGYQTSGGDLNCQGYINAVRIA